MLSDEIVQAGRKSAFQTARLSEPGGRSCNEDYSDFREAGDAVCWVVADGLGGHQGGQLASQTAVKAILESFGAHPELSHVALERHIAAAHEAVQNAQRDNPPLSGMRTTVVVLLTDSERALWAHAGDSRLYHFRACGIVAQTEDHSVPQALVKAGDITADQVRGHSDRNRLLRSVGDKGPISAAVVETPQELCANDAFLLCTDGFWEYVYETEMSADLVSSNSAEEWLRRGRSRLLERARGEYDNYTALAVWLVAASSPRAAESPDLMGAVTERGSQP